jgi:zona occludens toxin
MSIKIHHGPPGSYKTSGSVGDDFVAAVFSGRTIITNVRGLNDRQRVVDVLNKARRFFFFKRFKDPVPDSFDLIWIDTRVEEGREKLSRFFQWAPHGAFLMVDEAQAIWLQEWTTKELHKFDYEGGLDAASRDNRPANFLIAFEMHRHYGWDLVLTTPNIDKIRKDIRGCSEGAYKHKNQALIGVKGVYLEAFHLAEDSGKNNNDFLSVRNRRIPSFVWDLYKSTATGTHSDTIAGTPLWLNPRVLFFMVILSGLAVLIVSRPAPAVISGKIPAVSAPVDSKKTAAPVGGVVPGGVGDFQAASLPAALAEPFQGYAWRLVGVSIINHSVKIYVELSTDTELITLSGDELSRYGYRIAYFDQCHAELTFNHQSFPVRCKSIKPLTKTPSQNAAASLMASN